MSYSNYSTYLKYKNCCRPIGDTGPPGPAGPTGPAATIDISGSKGEILYFSETDILVSTDNVFIQEGNVTINNNLVVTGNLTIDGATTINNTLEVTGNVIINGNVNINGNLSMDGSFINDVSGIYFSDATYIGHGSSFDITTSETLDISAAGGVTVTGNLTIDGATTIRSTLDVSGNLSMNKNSIKNVDAIYLSENGSSNQIYIDYNFSELRMKSQGGIRFQSEDVPNATLYSEIDIAILNNNNLRFNNDNTYINSNTVNDKLSLYGNSIFMEARVNGDFVFTGNSNNVDLNFLTQSASGYIINYNHSDDKIRFNNNDFVIDKGNNFIGIQTDTPSATLEVNGNAIINGNLSMDNNYINDISYIQFSDNHNGQIFSPLERNSFLLYGNITTNASFKECIFNYNDTSYNGLISPQIFNTTGNVITFSNSILNNFNYATFSLCCSGILNSGPKNDIIFDLNDSTGKLQKNIVIDTRSITGNGSVAFGPVNFKITDISNIQFNNSIFKNNQYKLRVKSGGSSKYNLTKIRLAVNLI